MPFSEGINYLKFICTGHLSLLPQLFIYLTIYLNPYGFIDSCFVVSVIIQYYVTYFVAQIVSALTTQHFVCMHVFEDFVTFQYHKMHQAHLSLSGPTISYFSSEHWFLLLENSFRNQDLGSKHAHCYQRIMFLRPLSSQSKEKKACIHIFKSTFFVLQFLSYTQLSLYFSITKKT